MTDDITDDTPLTLKDACRIIFRDAIKPASLRSAADKGHLHMVRVGRTDFVTPAAIKEMMVRQCQEKDSPRAAISERTKRSGSSETDRKQSAQAAALATARALRKPSRNTSMTNSSPSSEKVISIASRSQRS